MAEKDYTVGELRDLLRGLADDTKLSFGGDLTVYRIKRCADDKVYLEWNEPFAYLDPAFRKRNPNVKVAFIDLDATAWNEDGLLGSVDVSVR